MLRETLFMRLVFVIAAVATLASACPAAAEEPVTRADVDAGIVSYYGGEGTSAYVVLGLSVVCVGAGAPLVAQKNSDFSRGLGIPLLSLGLIEGIGAAAYVQQTRAEARHYRELLARDPQAFRTEELAHMEGTQRRFVYYRATELALTVAGIGVASYGLATNRDFEKGLGTGLFAIGVPFLIIDTINDGRASRYHDQVRRFDPAIALQRDTHGWRLAFAAKF